MRRRKGCSPDHEVYSIRLISAGGRHEGVSFRTCARVTYAKYSKRENWREKNDRDDGKGKATRAGRLERTSQDAGRCAVYGAKRHHEVLIPFRARLRSYTVQRHDTRTHFTEVDVHPYGEAYTTRTHSHYVVTVRTPAARSLIYRDRFCCIAIPKGFVVIVRIIATTLYIHVVHTLKAVKICNRVTCVHHNVSIATIVTHKSSHRPRLSFEYTKITLI